jgi:hypothetical protein
MTSAIVQARDSDSGNAWKRTASHPPAFAESDRIDFVDASRSGFLRYRGRRRGHERARLVLSSHVEETDTLE